MRYCEEYENISTSDWVFGVNRKNIEKQFDRKIEAFGIRIKDEDQLKVRQDVFDENTLLALYRLANRRVISSIGGAISTGKEANIFIGERGDQSIVIKIYLVRTANFKAMTEYLDGDPRFSLSRRNRKEIVFAWTRKEFSNLKRADEAGIPVPTPFDFDRNILIMRFLGENDQPFPQLRNAAMEDPDATYQIVIGYMNDLLKKARLIHADLSEYNILYGGIPYLIDMGQSVTIDHPRAFQFLKRDIANINRFFSNYCTVIEERDIFAQITEGVIQEP